MTVLVVPERVGRSGSCSSRSDSCGLVELLHDLRRKAKRGGKLRQVVLFRGRVYLDCEEGSRVQLRGELRLGL